MRRQLLRQFILFAVGTLSSAAVIRGYVSDGSDRTVIVASAGTPTQAARASFNHELFTESRSTHERVPDGKPAQQARTDSSETTEIAQPGSSDASPQTSIREEVRSSVPSDSGADGAFSFNPLRAADTVELITDTMATVTPESTNYNAAVSNLLSDLGYSAVSGTRSTKADTDLPRATLHERYCENVAGSGETPNEVRLVSGIIPKGLILNQTDGALCGEPTETGIFRFALELRYGAGDSTTKTYRLVVVEGTRGATEGELRLLTAQLETGQLGAEYVFQLEADGGKQPYAWSALGLPDDLELDGATGLVAGTPQEEGEFPLEIRLTDADGKSVSSNLPLLIRATPVFIISHDIEEGTVSQPYQARFQAQGGVPPYRWDTLDGSLPEGLSLTPLTGALEGTPTNADDSVLRIRVTDSDNKTDSADIPLRIRPSSLRVLTQAMQDGFEGSPYQFSLAAEGGVPPYQWSISGVLPTGLSMTSAGLISGSPATFGEFVVTLVVTDSQQQEARRSARIRIQVADPAEPTPSETAEPTPVPNDGTDNGPGTNNVVLPPVTQLRAIPSNNKVGLVWTNPTHQSFMQTIVVRGLGVAPLTSTDGVVVYSGSGTTALDTAAENDREYVYVAFAEYAAGTEGSADPSEPAPSTPHAVQLTSKPDPFADRVSSFSPLDSRCFGCGSLPDTVLGAPHGQGESTGNSIDVVSIGARVNDDGGQSGPYGGSITLEFTDNIIVNGPGTDFTVFENAFRLAGTDDYFVEPATIEVSADGDHYFRFPIDFVPHYGASGELNLFNPFSYAKGFAGVHPVYANPNVAGAPDSTNTVRSGGDQFDLSDLPGAPLSWARFVRITSTGDKWITDSNGDLVRHSNSSPTFGASGRGNSGFDLDAVTAVNF
ncbi:MAG: putative Ig domain-containing protein [Bdellovibrionota bacterium]